MLPSSIFKMADTSSEKAKITQKNKYPEQVLSNIFLEIAENQQDPSTTFLEHIEVIYSFPKQDCVVHISQLQNGFLTILRDQLFYIFLDHFDDKTLENNGFSPSSIQKQSLKRRLKPLNSAYDIYNLGLSIQENQITNKLASDIIKPQQQHHQQQPNTEEINLLNGLNDVTIIDDNNKTIIEKLIELTKQNSQLVKENMNLSKRVISVEAKIDRILANLPTHQQHQLTPMPIQTPQHRLQTELFNLAADPEINNESSKNPNYNLPANSNQTRSSYRDITSLQDHNTSQQHKPAAPSKNQISQHKQSSPPKSVVYGGRQNNKTNIAGKTKPFSLFIGGFHLDLDKESVKSFIEREAHIQVIDIELNRKEQIQPII